MAWSKKIVLNFSAFDAAQFRLTMKENDQTSNDILWSANAQCCGSALKEILSPFPDDCYIKTSTQLREEHSKSLDFSRTSINQLNLKNTL